MTDTPASGRFTLTALPLACIGLLLSVILRTVSGEDQANPLWSGILLGGREDAVKRALVAFGRRVETATSELDWRADHDPGFYVPFIVKDAELEGMESPFPIKFRVNFQFRKATKRLEVVYLDLQEEGNGPELGPFIEQHYWDPLEKYLRKRYGTATRSKDDDSSLDAFEK